jgi:hypothetical protein
MPRFIASKNKRWVLKALDSVAHGEPLPGLQAVVMLPHSKNFITKVTHRTQCIFYADNWDSFTKILPQEPHIIGR